MSALRLRPGVTPGVSGVTRGLSKGQQAIRSKILATPAARLHLLLEEYAHANHALVPLSLVRTTPGPVGLVASEMDEDESPELLGEDGESFDLDPDGDFSERDGGRGIPPPVADLTFSVAEDGQRPRVVVEPGPVPTWCVRGPLAKAGLSRSARWILDCVDERTRRLVRIGASLAESQAAFLLGCWQKGRADLTLLKRTTRRNLARVLGVHESTVDRLVGRSLAEVPRVGLVPLRLFFGEARARSAPPARGDRGRNDALAAHIASIRNEKPEHAWSSRELRLELERRGVLARAVNKREKEAAERRIRRAAKLLDGRDRRR